MGYKIVISVSAIVAVLFTSGISIDAFADHNNPANRDKSAYLFAISGNGGGKWNAGGNDAFVRANNGVVHYSGYNWINEGAVSHGGGSAGNGGCITPHEAGGWHPPYAKIGNPKGWTANVDQYFGLLHNSEFNVPRLPEVNSQSKLLLMGYSFGGGTTAMIATDPRNSDVRFDLVYTNDPVGPNGVRFNAIANVGYEHSFDPCFGGGHSGNTIWDTPCLIPQEFLVTLPTYSICVLDQVERDNPWRVFESNVQYFFNRVQVGWIPPADVLVTPNSFATTMPSSWVNQGIVSSDTIINNSDCLSFGDSILALLFTDNASLGGLIACGHGYMGSLDTESYAEVEAIMNQMNTFPAVSTTEFFVDEGAELIHVSGVDNPTRWDISNLMTLTYRMAPIFDVSDPYDVVNTEFSTVTSSPGTTADLTTPNFDGPSVEISEIQVYDNGFPCNGCTDFSINENGSMLSDCSTLSGTEKEECEILRKADDFAQGGMISARGTLGLWDDSSITIHVANVAPTITSTFGTFEGNNLRLFVHTTDPSNADTLAGFNYTINWGDGSNEVIHGNSTDVFNHAYQQGAYTVTVTATDKDNGISDEITLDVETSFWKLLKIINDLRDDGTLNKGNANSFTSKVNGIMGSLDKENFTPVCNVANALINEIKQGFEKPGKLPIAISGDLIEKIKEEKDTVGCNGGVIDIVKKTIPDGHTAQFSFTGDVSGTIGDGQKIRLGNLTSGTYSSTETVPSGWNLANISCIANDYTKDLTTNSATINLQENEYAVCVFFNIIEGEIIVPSFIGRGSVSTSSDTAISDIRLHTVTGSSNPSSPQTSDDVTDDKKGGGGDEHLTRPTFGVSHETFETIVDSGFRFNDQSFTINDNHHTPFAQQTVNIGEVNSFEAKIYADKRLKVQEFLFGIPNVGEAHLAELGVEIWYDYNGEIEEVKAVQKSNVIDKETIVATHEKTKCQALDSEQKCDVTNVSVVFLEPLKDKVMAVKAIDYKGRYQITYLNEGVEIAGESLNPMQTYLIPSNVRDQGLIKVTQLAKYSPYWQSDDDRMFEMNSFGSFKEINITFERFQDTGTAYTRLHSGFGGVMAYELKRATGIFDASELISEFPDSYDTVLLDPKERMTDEMKQKMEEQEEIAKKILEESKVQARW